MRFGSVCSGIEAASVAWHPLGWKAAWLSEIEPFPSAVLAHHYPDVPNLGDMTALPERIASGEVEAPDLFCGGTPCQAFSVAGLRRSLDDDRGNLSLTFCEIANAIDTRRQDAGLVPAIIFWENVPGVLNTKDNAFGCFLGALAGEDEPLIAPGGRWSNAGCVYGPQRAVAWRVLDAQYFGVAQRRRRVFVVASARTDFDPTAVLFESEGVRRDTAPSREEGEVTPTLTKECTGVSRTGHNEDGWYVTAPRLTGMHETVGALCADSHPGAYSGQDAYTGRLIPAVAQPVSIQGNLIGRDAGGPHGVGASESGVMYTLTKTDVHGVAQPIAWDEELNASIDIAGTLLRGGAGGRHDGVAQPITFGAQMSAPQTDVDLVQTLQAKNPMAVACIGGQHPNAAISEDQSPTLTSAMGMGGGHIPAVAQPIAFQQTADCLTAAYGTKWNGNASATNGSLFAKQAMQVRRLTPIECERLQGFPDGYTNIPWRKADESPDGPRYKALGNSWAVPVVRWIGKRIQKQGENHVKS